MKIKDILKNKGPEVFTIGMAKPISEAIQTLVNNNIGSLIVLDEMGKIAGIISERDILRQSYKNPDNYQSTAVSEAMTTKIIVAEPDDDIEYVESIMTDNRIRHLPIVHNKILTGIISIGDVVKYQLSEMRHEKKYLMDYIGGSI